MTRVLATSIWLDSKANYWWETHMYGSFLFGDLMYVTICSRPDISQIFNMIGRYMRDLGKIEWQAAKWILISILATTKLGLKFERDYSSHLFGYVESDYVDDLDRRHSTMGTLYTFANAPLSWRSKLQFILDMWFGTWGYIRSTFMYFLMARVLFI